MAQSKLTLSVLGLVVWLLVGLACAAPSPHLKQCGAQCSFTIFSATNFRDCLKASPDALQVIFPGDKGYYAASR